MRTRCAKSRRNLDTSKGNGREAMRPHGGARRSEELDPGWNTCMGYAVVRYGQIDVSFLLLGRGRREGLGVRVGGHLVLKIRGASCGLMAVEILSTTSMCLTERLDRTFIACGRRDGSLEGTAFVCSPTSSVLAVEETRSLRYSGYSQALYPMIPLRKPQFTWPKPLPTSRIWLPFVLSSQVHHSIHLYQIPKYNQQIYPASGTGHSSIQFNHGIFQAHQSLPGGLVSM